MKITELKPQRVFEIFNEICAIPHGSGNTARISQYCADYAKKLGLPCYCDNVGNVIITKEGIKGYENSPEVILQGHIDMVCVKTEDCPIDMETEGIIPVTDGEYVTAEGTTLGGDDGIAVAYILALLSADDIPHPPIEALFTVDEETGMTGARNLDYSRIKGKTLINIDSEEEGILTVGCAGGSSVRCVIPMNYTDCGEKSFLKLSVGGLTGGHSGTEIDKNRINGIKLLAELLAELSAVCGINLCSLSGGGKENAIPDRAEAVIACESADIPLIMNNTESFLSEIKGEARANEPELKISCVETEKSERCADKASTEKAIFALTQCPDGIREMSPEIAGAVKTSLNLGIASADENGLAMSFLIRSSSKAGKRRTVSGLKGFIEYIGGKAEVLSSSEYPSWEYKPNSPLRDVMVSTYEELYGRKPQIVSIHAGLECGLFAEKMPEVDMVSFGPDIENAHTPEERMNAASVARCYDYLLAILKKLK